MSDRTLMLLLNLSIYALVGFLCWWFNNGWPVAILFAIHWGPSESTAPDKPEQDK